MRRKKDSVNVSMRLDREIWEMLKEYAERMGQSYTVATERILEAFLEKQMALQGEEEHTTKTLG